MNPQTSSSTLSSTSVHLHCQHRTASGRHCRMAVTDPASGFCLRHAAQRQKDLDLADLSATLIGDAEDFRSAVTINRSLGELYKLQARNQIAPRRSAVMAYTANLLLRTLPAIEHELQPEDEPMRLDFGDLPRPQRDPAPFPAYPGQLYPGQT